MDKNTVAIELAQSLEGTEIAKMVSIGLFTLAVYEYMITFDEEIKYFWTGRWTASRLFFLINRYILPFIMVFVMSCFTLPDPSPEFCKPAIQTAFILNIIAVAIIQVLLVTRIWHLFQGSEAVQLGIFLCCIFSMAASLVLLLFATKDLQILSSADVRAIFPTASAVGCRALRPPNFWKIYLPSLALHTIVYCLTAVWALKNRRLLQHAAITKRLFQDGGFFYFVVFVSVSLTTVGSYLYDVPRINLPAIYSHFLLTITSLAMSRVMLRIHSLAANLGPESPWFLSYLELNRTVWMRDAYGREIIIGRYSEWNNNGNVREGDNGSDSSITEMRVMHY